MAIRYNSDEGGWHQVPFTYIVTKMRGKMIKSLADEQKDGGGFQITLSDGALVQILEANDGFEVNYMTP